MADHFTGMMAAKLARPVEKGQAEQPLREPPDSPWRGQENSARADRDGEVGAQLSRRSLGDINSLHGAKAARRHAITELMFFSSVGDLVRCQRLCAAWRIDPKEARDYDKRTPLHTAAAEGCYSVVQWLLQEAGLPVNPVDRFGRTPLEEAVRGDFSDVAELIQKHGGCVYLEDRQELVSLAKSGLSKFLSVYDRPTKGDGESTLQPEWEIDRKDLKLLNRVGDGEFGTVYKAKWLGSVVAVKVLKGSDAVALGDLRSELHVLQKVHHPQAVQFLGACTRETPYMIVTEFIPGGSLSDYFTVIDLDQSRRPTLRRAVQIALDCARCMCYMHARRHHLIVHRDLKPANLMLAGIPPDITDRSIAQRFGVCKVADFGLSKSLALKNDDSSKTKRKMTLDMCEGNFSTELYKLTGETGSYRYMSPEVFRHEPYNSSVDVYAFAMIAFELFEGYIPFGHLHPVEAARQAAIEGTRPVFKPQNRWSKKLPAELTALVKECWAPRGEDRPDFSHICTRLERVMETLPPDKLDKKKKCTIM